MADIFTRQKRSKVMARIRGRGNEATEVALVRLFRKNGIAGWRRHLPLFGRPDFVFRRLRTAVFVDGCFWHGCPKCYRRPSTNREFWDKKFARNRERDKLVNRTLRAKGWTVFRFWEHELKRPDQILKRLRSMLGQP